MDVIPENDYEENKNVLRNIKLAKFIGLYQLLNPRVLKYRGYNVYHIAVVLAVVLYELPLSIMFLVQSVYYSASDTDLALVSYAVAQSIAFVCYRSMCAIYSSDEIWRCLKITRFAFTCYGRYNRTIFEKWRAISVRITCAFLAISAGCLTSCSFGPLLLKGAFMSVKDHDGSISRYHLNVVNLFFFTSAETYNAHFNAFYVIEVVFLSFGFFLSNAMDTLLFALCLAIICRFQMVSDAFQSIEQNYFVAYSNDGTNSNVLPKNELNTLLYKDLITILKDHQKVMRTFKSFLTIFRSALLVQIITASTTIVTVCFILTMNFIDGKSVDMGTTMKMFFALQMYLFQLYVSCYLFEIMNTQKDSIIFALYSSNWTEMDMKCKKLILLAMKLNNANQMKLKFSNLNVVNLQLFYKTMRICYSMISMLINSAKQHINS